MVEIDALLEKNPDVRRVFKKNQALFSQCPPAKKAKYRLGNPFGSRRPVDDTPVSQPRPKASFFDLMFLQRTKEAGANNASAFSLKIQQKTVLRMHRRVTSDYPLLLSKCEDILLL